MAYKRNDNGKVRYSQVGQFQSQPSNGKPPLAKPLVAERFSKVPEWEKKFCYFVGSVPWKKVIDVKKCMFMHPNVVKWNDSAVREAFDNAKNRFYAKIKGLRCDIPLPDPNIYIDNVDWNAPVDHELYMDLDEEAEALHIVEEKVEEPVLLDRSILLDKSFSRPGWPEPTGWGDKVTKPPEATKTEEPFILTSSFLLDWSFTGQGWGPTGWGDKGVTKPPEPNEHGWESNEHRNFEKNSWEQQYHVPVDQHAKDYGWRQYQTKKPVYHNGVNNYRAKKLGYHQKAGYHNGANDYQMKKHGYHQKPEYHHDAIDYHTKKPGYHHGTNDYHMKKHGYHHGANDYRTNGGRKRNGGGGGGRRENFDYVDKVALSGRC